MRCRLSLRGALFFALVFPLSATLVAGRANAEMEICPATAFPAASAVPTVGSIRVELAAKSARSVDSVLAIYTDHGFYTAALPNVALVHQPMDRRRGDDRYAFRSSVMNVSVPDGVKVFESWLRSATVTAGQADWIAAGPFTCYPPDHDPTLPSGLKEGFPTPLPEPLRTPDPALTTVAAVAAPGLENLICRHPFAPAHVTHSVAPKYPFVADESPATSLIEVELDPTGALMEATVFRSAGDSRFDSAALVGARATTYLPPIAFCRTVYGRYIFRASFGPF